MVAGEAHTGLISPESTEGSWNQWKMRREKEREEGGGRQGGRERRS